MAVVKASGVVTKFPILIDVELNNVDFSVAPSGLYSANANNYVGNNPIFRSDNATIFSDAFTFDILHAFPVGTDLSTMKAGNRRLSQRKYVFDIVQVYGNNHYMKLHFKKIDGATTQIENMTAEGAENNVITVEEYPNNPNHNIAFAVRMKDTRHNLTGIALYIGFAVQWRADNFSYNLGQPSYIFIQETLEANGDQFLFVDENDFNDEDYGDESTGDGYGQNGTHPAFNHSSDIIGLPPIPSVSTSSVGFIHLYNVTQNQLDALSDYLFPDVLQDIADIMAQLPVALNDLPNVLVPILRAFASIFAYRDSVQYIIDLHAIPCAPSVGGSDYIKVGALSTDISAGVISSDYVEVDCGALSIPEQFQNFLDYMVSCKIYMPFVGFVDIKPELWNGGTIGLKYRFNVIDGSFMAYLVATSGKSRLTNTVIGQYGGSACLHLPMVAAEYGAIIGGIVQGAMSVDKVAGAGASQMASAEAGLASALMNFNVNPPMQQSNGYNASAGFLGGRTPYLMIEYPVPQFSARYTHEKGLPLNVTMAFKDLRGYTEIDESVDLSGIQAPIDIIDEIRSALASGTIF